MESAAVCFTIVSQSTQNGNSLTASSRRAMIFGKHLILQELTLPPSTEQIPPFDGWLVARVAEGVGYWLQHDRPACQLATGDVFVATRVADGRLRASQLEALKLQFF